MDILSCELPMMGSDLLILLFFVSFLTGAFLFFFITFSDFLINRFFRKGS